MKHSTLFSMVALSVLAMQNVSAQQHQTINFCSVNTAKSYNTYSNPITIGAQDIYDIQMGRYSYFQSYVSGTGIMNLFAGGERCYLGGEKGNTYPDWTQFTGTVNILPYNTIVTNAGFYGVILGTGKKNFNAEDVPGSIASGKVNNQFLNSRVLLKKGATIATEQGVGGFRFGELNTEEGSFIQGYMKSSSKYSAYILVGAANTNATLAGTIAPAGNAEANKLGIIKEGTGTYTITGNNNFISGGLRILDGKVLINNDADAAQKGKLSGATGAMGSNTKAVAFVFGKGILGGHGHVSGTIDNYGTILPGDNGEGQLRVVNYKTTVQPDLIMHPNATIRTSVVSASDYGQVSVAGNLVYADTQEDFSVSTALPRFVLSLDPSYVAQVGDEFTLVTAHGMSLLAGEGNWKFRVVTPSRYTWSFTQDLTADGFTLKAKVVSLDDDPDAGKGGEQQGGESGKWESGVGPIYHDGYTESADNNTIRYYAEKTGKGIGLAYSGWRFDIDNDNDWATTVAGREFNLVVPENELKFECTEPNRDQFNFGDADRVMNFAVRHGMKMRGHTLVWHKQNPQWISSDGKKNDHNFGRSEMLAIMKNHIFKVMEHYKGKIICWDIVNECVADEQPNVRTNPSACDLCTSVWRTAIGDDYIDSAFVYAHQADPQAKLYLNDYDVEFMGTAKSQAFYNLAARLKKSGIPIDGVGFQSHFKVGELDSVKLDDNIRRFAELGLECAITELDLGMKEDNAQNRQQQAIDYRTITDIVIKNPNCPYLVIWGLCDNQSWRTNEHALIYDDLIHAKDSYYGIRSAFRHQVATGIRPLFIQKPLSPSLYDLSGRKQSSPHGLFIQNGKKIIR